MPMKKITFNSLLNHKAYSYEPMKIEVEKVIPLYGKRFEQMKNHPLDDCPEIIENRELMYMTLWLSPQAVQMAVCRSAVPDSFVPEVYVLRVFPPSFPLPRSRFRSFRLRDRRELWCRIRCRTPRRPLSPYRIRYRILPFRHLFLWGLFTLFFSYIVDCNG